ncbi:MAG: sulfurtransferase-like selenium metabolism protein YedF [Hungatella hathewayi]|nr:sulfurtransferase-like selenium metabolism protein YedF [Hungatella hathewayi]
MNKTVDARNIPCPGPVIEAKKALKDMTEGVLTILVDNAAAVQNLTKLATFMKLPVTSEKLDEGTFQVEFQTGSQSGSQAGSQAQTGSQTGAEVSGELPVLEETLCAPDSRRKGLVVALSSDHMGEGDETLGKALMKGFVYALTNLEHLPETILLYNGGARLSVEGSESLEDLKLLEAQGVEVLTCGTCLNHYQLTEKLAVGSVTNMYEIVEKMTLADSVVKP